MWTGRRTSGRHAHGQAGGEEDGMTAEMAEPLRAGSAALTMLLIDGEGLIVNKTFNATQKAPAPE